VADIEDCQGTDIEDRQDSDIEDCQSKAVADIEDCQGTTVTSTQDYNDNLRSEDCNMIAVIYLSKGCKYELICLLLEVQMRQLQHANDLLYPSARLCGSSLPVHGSCCRPLERNMYLLWFLLYTTIQIH